MLNEQANFHEFYIYNFSFESPSQISTSLGGLTSKIINYLALFTKFSPRVEYKEMHDFETVALLH